MQLSANTQVKTIEGHYTGHFKAVVTKPQNVMVMRDVACAGYVAGCNVRFFADSGNKVMDANTAKMNIQDRLSFADDMTDKYASILAFPAYEVQFENSQLDTVMCARVASPNHTRTRCRSPTDPFCAFPSAGRSPAVCSPGRSPASRATIPSRAASRCTRPTGPCSTSTKCTTARTSRPLRTRTSSRRYARRCAPRTKPLSLRTLTPTRLQKLQGSTNNATCFLGPSRRYDRACLRLESRAPPLPMHPRADCSPVLFSCAFSLHQELHEPGARPGPVRCAALKPDAPLSPLTTLPLVCAASAPTPSLATRAGAAGRACRSRCAIAAAAAAHARTLAH